MRLVIDLDDSDAERLNIEPGDIFGLLTTDGEVEAIVREISERDGTEWCPVCHTYHVDPGAKTDAGRLVRPCPLLPPGVGANHPINMEP